MDTLDHSFDGITVPFDDPKRMQLLFQIMTGVDKGRSGWEDRGILKRHMESVRAHSGKVARAAGLFCLMHPELGLNLFKMMQMALFHDMAEYKVRDYTPGEIPDEEKYKQEKLVFEELVPYL